MSTLFYANADFDYRIGGIFTETIASRVRNWYLWFLTASGPGDYILIPEHTTTSDVLDKYTAYLHRQKIEYGEIISKPIRHKGNIFCFGYDPNSRLLFNDMIDASVMNSCFCDFTALRLANSKLFCARLLHKIGDGYGVISTELLYKKPFPFSFPLVIRKPFGSSSNANLIACSQNDIDSLISRGLLLGLDEIALDRWYARSGDYSAGFHMDSQGYSGFNIRRLHNSERGIFSMVRPLRTSDVDDGIVSSAKDSAKFLFDELSAIDYHGPVNFDFFTYRDEQGIEKIKPFCDINARNTMAAIGAIVSKRLGAVDYALATFNARQLADKGLTDYGDFISLSDKIFQRFSVNLLLVSPLVRKGSVTFLMYSQRYFDEVAVRSAIEALGGG